MNAALEKLVRSLVVMKAAGGALDEILELAQAYRVRAIHFHQLAVPAEEEPARQALIEAMKAH